MGLELQREGRVNGFSLCIKVYKHTNKPKFFVIFFLCEINPIL